MKTDENMLELKVPVKAKKSKCYLAVLEDAEGVTHYWNFDGNYDGYDAPCGSDAADKILDNVKDSENKIK